MELSYELIAQLVKSPSDGNQSSATTTMYGTIVYDGKPYVKLDGSNPDAPPTPVATTTNVKGGERVLVMIKDHTATVIGNVSSPAATSEDIANVEQVVTNAASKINEFEIVMAHTINAEEIQSITATFENLRAKLASIGQLSAFEAKIDELSAKLIEAERVTATDINAITADLEKLTADFASITDIDVDNLNALYADINELRGYTAEFTYVSTEVLSAIKGHVGQLQADKLDVTWANIDYSKINKAVFDEFYAQSGLIENITMEDGTVTGHLVGVTIKGDLIEGNTVVADKLVIKGSDGLYYKLNFEGGNFTNSEEIPTDSLHGSVITAKSVTAEKVSVSDLVAFDATIGGFKISDEAIYSGVKETVDNTTSGLYLGKDGQISLGDATNYLRYYRDEAGNWKLEISAESVLFGYEDRSSISDIKALTEHVKIGTWTDKETGEVNPSVELSEGDSDFKQVITNKASRIMDGDSVVTEMDADGIETENVKVRGEIRQGSWVWTTHGKGNLGLMWKEATE